MKYLPVMHGEQFVFITVFAVAFVILDFILAVFKKKTEEFRPGSMSYSRY